MTCLLNISDLHRPPREREAPIEMVDDFLATLHVSCFVAMYFANYNKFPCIGKVLAVEEDNFKVHYWKMDSSVCSPTKI